MKFSEDEKENEKQLRLLLYTTQVTREIRQKIIVITSKIHRHRQKIVARVHTFLYRQTVKQSNPSQ